MKLPAQLLDWDDGRADGERIRVTLAKGWQWPNGILTDIDPLHMRGFDTPAEARAALRTEPLPCTCARCADAPPDAR